MKKSFSIVIPVRFNSSRFPGKPLKKIKSIPLMIWVGKKCQQVTNSKNIFFATDNKKIFETAKKYNFSSIMTSKKCLTGTDRVAEASKLIKKKIIINVQGDEPLVSGSDIKKVLNQKMQYPNHVICGYNSINTDAKNTDIPKVVFNKNKDLLYISRSLIPGAKNKKKIHYHRQVCVYAFNHTQLKKFSAMKQKTHLEKLEDIEILRFLELNIPIKMVKLSSKNVLAVDRPEHVKIISKYLK